MQHGTHRNTSHKAIGIFATICVFALAGCQQPQHGKYTAQSKQAATAKIDAMKSQNEHQMAVQSFESGELDKAMRHTDKALSLNEKSTRTMILKGKILLEMGNLEAASQTFKLAQQQEPRNVNVYYYQGLLAERVSRKDEALGHYLKACELDTQNPQYPIAAAEMMIDLKEYDRAEAFLLGQVGTFRHTAGIQQSLGHVSLLQDKPMDALTHFREAQMLAPDEGEIAEDLATTLFAVGQVAEAETTLTRLTSKEPFTGRRDLVHMRAKCLMALDRNHQARDILLGMTKDQEGANDVEAWISLGQVSYQLRDAARLRQAFTRIIAMAPDRPEGHILKGLHQRRSEDFIGAEQSFKKALSLGQDAETLTLLGLVQYQQGKTKAAQQSFSQACVLDPNDLIARELAASPKAVERMVAADED